MSGAYSIHSEMVSIYKIVVRIPKGRKYFRELYIDERILLKWISEEEGVDWINLLRGMKRWRSPANKLMNFQVQ
jgi:hypothetical protein